MGRGSAAVVGGVAVEYQADVKMSERVMTQLSEAYRKIRNTFRYRARAILRISIRRAMRCRNDQLDEIDRWMLERTADLVKKCREWYAGYEFHRVYHAIHDFCVVDLSSFYYDVLKDRLYTKAAKSKSRRSAQTAVLEDYQRAGPACCADPGLHRGGRSGSICRRGRASTESVHMALFSEEAENFARALRRKQSRSGNCSRRCAGKC